MQQSQRAQRLDQMQLAPVEVVEPLVAVEDVAQLRLHGLAVAGQQHPQVLDRRTVARVVEIDEVRPVVGP